MKTMQNILTTVSSRCSDILSGILLKLLLIFLPVPALAQRTVWELPDCNEKIRALSVTAGNAFARDTYLSASRYDGWAVGFENDSWTGYRPERLFCYTRSYSTAFFSPMTNRLDGGSTLTAGFSDCLGFMWPAIQNRRHDLLIGPSLMFETDVMYNRQNSNNPVDVAAYVGGGLSVDYTMRFSLFRYDMAMQATLYAVVAGLGFAPDYDQPYWYMYKYSDYGKAFHFITPINNPAFIQQVALVLPCGSNRFRIGYTFDNNGNKLGGHKRNVFSGMFTIGCAFRFQNKEWK